MERIKVLGNPFIEGTGNNLSKLPALKKTPLSESNVPVSSNHLDDLCHKHNHRTINENPSSAVPNGNVWSQIPSTTPHDFNRLNSKADNLHKWNLSFDGCSSDKIDIERFLYRVERTAARYQVSQIRLVEELGVLLKGEALEWYWVFLERNGLVSWVQLREELVRRFQRHQTAEDILMELDNRKQKLPKESFYDFYSSLLKIAMKSPTIIPEEELLRYLKKNMRPGLQFHLQMADKKILSIDQLVAVCVSWEQTWLRNGYYPENFLQTQKKSVNELKLISSPGEAPISPEYESHINALQYPKNNEKPSVNFAIPISNIKKVTTMSIDQSKVPVPTSSSNLVICWNCHDMGHVYKDCATPPTHLFCYGCGTENVIKPHCVRCKNYRSGNGLQDMRTMGRTHYPRTNSPRPQQNNLSRSPRGESDY